MKRSLIYLAMFLSLALVLPISQSANPRGQNIQPLALLPQAPSAPVQSQSQAVRTNPDFGRMPLYFIANQGQMDERVEYYVQGKDKSVYFTPGGLTIVLNRNAEIKPGLRESGFAGRAVEVFPGRTVEAGAGQTGKGGLPESQPAERWVLKLDFIGADQDVRPVGAGKAEGVVSYFTGRPQDWVTGLPTYSTVVYPGLWPGIDLVYSGTVNRLKYEFVVHPGADPSLIRLAYRGAEKVEVTAEGRLDVDTPSERFYDDIPVAYQEREGKRIEVPLAYKMDDPMDDSDGGLLRPAATENPVYSYGFDVGDYDRTLPLILDPAIIIYCGYIGGSGSDNGYRIAVDSSGNAYLVGQTDSSAATFPVTVGPDLTQNGGDDIFVAKVNSSGTGLIYCGYIGGNDHDMGRGIAIDNDGNAYLTGITWSNQTTFPVTVGPDLTFNGTDDCFVAKVNSSGTGLIYCGYIGGASYDEGYDIAVDGEGNAYIGGLTDSTQATFPVLTGPDITHNGLTDAFVAKVSASGSSLGYCGYIGGGSSDYGNGIAVDGSGNAYVTGFTYSSEATFPCIEGPDLTHNGGMDAFVAKMNTSGALSYSGFIGGSGDDCGYDVAVAGGGYAYVTGYTNSNQATFPDAIGPDLTYNGGLWDAFVARVNPSGSGLGYCGYIGGSGADQANVIAVDSAGSAFVTGYTGSAEDTFPVCVGPDLTYNGGSYDAFVAKIKSSGLTLDFCGYIGGSIIEFGRGIAIDGSGSAYIAGVTMSSETSFPVTVGPFLSHSGDYDAFVAKVVEVPIWHPRHAVGDFDGDGSDEAAVDFGTMGIYLYDGGIWTQLSAANPESLVAADVDGNTVDELLADLGTSGLWLWNAGAWNQVSGVNVEGMAAGDVDADGADEVVGDFGTVGMWLYNGGSWSQLSGVNADYIDCANLDGSGGDEIVGDFGATGLWTLNTGAWAQLSGVNADYMAFGNTDGSGGEDLSGDFGATGLWLWSQGSGWTQLSGVNADFMITGDMDASGDDELSADFGVTGLWLWDSGSWTQLSGADADFMIRVDVDGNGDDEVIGDFGAIGLWLVNGGSWTQLSGMNADYLMAGDFDGDNADEFLADFGSLGVWLWDGGWLQVSSTDPE